MKVPGGHYMHLGFGMLRSDRVPLAWRNLTHKRSFLAVSVAGIAFATLILFMEMGFLNGLYDSQTNLLEQLDADLLMVSSIRHNLSVRELFPRSRLVQAAALPEVVSWHPLYIEEADANWRDPPSGRLFGTRVLAFDMNGTVLGRPDVIRHQDALRRPRTVLFDSSSRPFFGKVKPGTVSELAGQDVEVVGLFSLGADFAVDGNVIMSDDTLFTLFPHQRPDRVAIGLIRLARGADAAAVAARLNETMQPAVDVMTRDQAIERERQHWRKTTPAGYVLGMGLVVGFVIGVVICYQILYTDILDHLPQLATLKAMGFHDRHLVGLVLRQAFLLGLIGFFPGLLLAFGFYAYVGELSGLQLHLSVPRAALILSMTTSMCLFSGALAVRKALTADPAELF